MNIPENFDSLTAILAGNGFWYIVTDDGNEIFFQMEIGMENAIEKK